MNFRFGIKIFFAIFLSFSAIFYPQTTKTNLNLFFELLSDYSSNFEKSGKRVVAEKSKPEYKTLENFINNYNLSKKYDDTLHVKIDTAFVKYAKIYRDGFFGDYFLVRTANIALGENNGVERKLSLTDTLKLSEYPEIETAGLPFTKCELPEEPLLQSIIEPVVFVVTATAVVFTLFFKRSKE